MSQFSELLSGQTVLPIIQTSSVAEGVKIAECMYEGGLRLVEVVLRTQESLAALQAIKSEIPDLCVGAGTVTNAELLTKALQAGSDFIVTPAGSATLLTNLSDTNVPCLPGVSNTADILLAREFGFTEMKLFPASLSGGAPFLSAVSSVFSDVTFCPTGGVTATNKADYLSLNNVFAVGGTWMAKSEWVTAKNWQMIIDSCRNANK
ncbi:bifunctional 4-hydroxy-2-oxoglutarate aldolase/2-dehydro-3-deoxy-phosphogluconate aldolase [Psychrosphaera sp. B3R10]|uniref:bifunctional 4-hydroxy-2-oxoglutarate aldolase/2-dehydro-3-deoxy-phosphogluconate aldolase n=1 Tax=unclassified Psychrosphaera TaxID=2641570 RepID=UPI001C0870AA|nr:MULTISPECIES: bifunctional 4-hydroxy-2-oxoglutarate aldolase/2-dehydro-3-deoxy-phosphogluconate aldolase [unclassified Psychrosphaera]MBU2881032.1 bifunctional 4-hydroxy-2-oxoglutarate aldolase/2-dehydro-3-deoxy-phosphogluconate aldolase [Psychrosphaera sp. I2R16]MBU2989956.1 bifunctional 4-hydroxy-2-oxoglutarate aldolase/2-dehydro-3-deoxy-phosphogluconate aldolase [Psychrosphaera sp. B3R10]